MTAISGLLSIDGEEVEPDVVARMGNLLAPYGSDDTTIRIWPGGGFSRALLRATPEDRHDRQPYRCAESDSVLVFDGRLDNRADLADSLGIAGTRLRDMADSALMLDACRRFDMADLAGRLLGDFAFAYWQAATRRLWLGRDPLGVRPLYWTRTRRYLAFATMPRALFAIPGVPRSVCEERLHDYLCLLPTIGPQSFYRDIYRVEPGQVLCFDGPHPREVRRHSWEVRGPLKLKSDDAYVEAFGEALERAVACRLRAPGPVASELSSGFDSATVTAVAARQLAAQDTRLLAFTAAPRQGFDGPVPKGWHADEGPGARALAARFDNIDHRLVRGSLSPLEELDPDIDFLDRPPLNPCNMVWLNAIRDEAVRAGSRVLLTGAKGNATISYAGREELARWFVSGNLGRWWREARGLRNRPNPVRWRGLMALTLAPYAPKGLWALYRRLRGRQTQLSDYCAVSPQFLSRLDHPARVRATGWDVSYRPWGDGLRMRIAMLNRMDDGDYNAATNARGLEERDPTADRRLAELCLAIPGDQYLRNGQFRWLLKRYMGDLLPPEMWSRRTRGYQAADWYEALGQDLTSLRAGLERMRARDLGQYIDLDDMVRAVDDWPRGGWDDEATIDRYRFKVLRGFSVGRFVEKTTPENRL